MATAWRAMAGLLMTCCCAATVAPALAQPAALQVEHFDVEQVPRLEPGALLAFSVFGTPGAAASVRIEGARDTLRLQETQPGVYEGTYIVGPAEHILPQARVDASLQRGRQVARAVLAEPLQLGAALPDARAASAEEPAPATSERMAAVPPVPAAVPRREAALADCSDCAIVESVRAVEVDNRPGLFSGGLLGTILGGITDRHASRKVRYDVALRLPDGSLEIRSYAQSPPYRIGDRVRPGPVALVRLARPATRP